MYAVEEGKEEEEEEAEEGNSFSYFLQRSSWLEVGGQATHSENTRLHCASENPLLLMHS